jgi:hypothetical protein
MFPQDCADGPSIVNVCAVVDAGTVQLLLLLGSEQTVRNRPRLAVTVIPLGMSVVARINAL